MDLQEPLASVPGVQAVSAAESTLQANQENFARTRTEGPKPKDGTDLNPHVNGVLPNFFRALGIPLMSGREFTTADRLGPRKVAVVNESFVKHRLGGQNAIGKRIGFGFPQRAKLDIEIVGVVKDTKTIDLKKEMHDQVWTPMLQSEHPASMTFYLVSTLDPVTVANLARAAVRRLTQRYRCSM